MIIKTVLKQLGQILLIWDVINSIVPSISAMLQLYVLVP